MAGQMDMGQLLADQLVKAAKLVEEQLDVELNKLDNMDEDEMEALKAKRLAALKKQQAKKQEWLTHGHGKYEEIPEEKEFFNVTKNSERVVVHFYRPDSFRSKIVDKHLAILAPKHVETKFCKINAEKCPFLTDRLKIRVIPTLALIKDAKTQDYIVGFTGGEMVRSLSNDLGNHDEFTTEMLEWRIARSDLINYSGDLMNPPDAKGTKKINVLAKKNKSIRGKATGEGDDDDSDDNDW